MCYWLFRLVNPKTNPRLKTKLTFSDAILVHKLQNVKVSHKFCCWLGFCLMKILSNGALSITWKGCFAKAVAFSKMHLKMPTMELLRGDRNFWILLNTQNLLKYHRACAIGAQSQQTSLLILQSPLSWGFK